MSFLNRTPHGECSSRFKSLLNEFRFHTSKSLTKSFYTVRVALGKSCLLSIGTSIHRWKLSLLNPSLQLQIPRDKLTCLLKCLQPSRESSFSKKFASAFRSRLPYHMLDSTMSSWWIHHLFVIGNHSRTVETCFVPHSIWWCSWFGLSFWFFLSVFLFGFAAALRFLDLILIETSQSLGSDLFNWLFSESILKKVWSLRELFCGKTTINLFGKRDRLLGWLENID